MTTLDYPPDVLALFADLAARPDLLGVVADKLLERGDAIGAELGGACLWAWENGKWPKWDDRGSVPPSRRGYYWSFTVGKLAARNIAHALLGCRLPIPDVPTVRGSFLTFTRNAPLPECFRHLALILRHQPAEAVTA